MDEKAKESPLDSGDGRYHPPPIPDSAREGEPLLPDDFAAKIGIKTSSRPRQKKTSENSSASETPSNGSGGGRILAFDPAVSREALRLLNKFGRRFDRESRKDPTLAITNLARGLMRNMGTLAAGGALSVKDNCEVTKKFVEIVGGIKSAPAEGAADPLSFMQKFLRGEGNAAVQP